MRFAYCLLAACALGLIALPVDRVKAQQAGQLHWIWSDEGDALLDELTLQEIADLFAYMESEPPK